ncbi:hypothetical protein [Sulfurospirillum arcachonense]|uniref:hypothetical protein n=1 Tax=Sulfurospirillum arcachonense TaxID=57666 RepID=UPI000468AE91|nr:hypothetical protein [Sulfurospirillum arcachonense]
MNYIIMITLLISSIFAQNEYGKIDMHGGKKTSLYSGEKKSLKNPNIGISSFLDNNQSKKIKSTKKQQ